MKTCYKCSEQKPVTEFHSVPANKDGLHSNCKECVRAVDRARYVKRKEQCIERASKHYYANREAILESRKAYNKENRPLRAMWNAKRRAKTAMATPDYTDMQYVRDLYSQASEASKLFESFGVTVAFQVDHIIPLNGKTVCGFHNEYNLQILSRAENNSKTNRFDSDMYATQWSNV